VPVPVVNAGKWYTEFITPHQGFTSRLRRIVYSGRTEYQAVEIIETESYGRTLLLDGKTQSTEADEFVYHEALVQPAMLAHPAPRTVFIGGGGEGATLREVLRHSTVHKVVMVDLDGEVVRLCKEHLAHEHQGAFQDPRANLVIGDAKAFLERTPERFDVIVLDLVDPMDGGPSYTLYTQEFYRTVKSKLAPGGVMVTQAGPVSVLNVDEVHTIINHTLKSVFSNVASYTVAMQSFGEPWGFVVASDAVNPKALPPADIDRRLTERSVKGLRNYDGEWHQGIFGLPRYIRDAIAKETRVVTVDNPVFVF
jgi:spermidine synthase